MKILTQINARLNVTAKKIGTIETDTPMLPVIVADRAVGIWIDGIADIYPELVKRINATQGKVSDYLAAEAERFYKTNKRFNKAMHSTRSREILTSFMLHWMTARMIKSFPVVKLRDLPKRITGVSEDL
jgi:hypothetical protein